jgi:hypothetical protein
MVTSSQISNEFEKKLQDFEWYANPKIGGFKYQQDLDIIFDKNTPKEKIYTGKVVDIDSTHKYWDNISVDNFCEIVITKNDPTWKNQTIHSRKIGYCVQFSPTVKRWWSISLLRHAVQQTKTYQKQSIEKSPEVNDYFESLCINNTCPFCQIKADGTSDSDARRRVVAILHAQNNWSRHCFRREFNISCMCIPCQDAFVDIYKDNKF